MEIYVKIAACSVVCALLCAVLKPHEGALALSDRIILSLRRAGRIGGLSINGVRAKAWEQSGQVVDMRPFYRTVIELGLSGYLQSVRGDMALLE